MVKAIKKHICDSCGGTIKENEDFYPISYLVFCKNCKGKAVNMYHEEEFQVGLL
jgi:Zn finger protein HypA/HybF involved in hydrogenase expression